MPNFEDKQLSFIREADVDALNGREENQRLEFKETIDGVPSYEVVKDIDALTNGGGGYLVIGAVEDQKTKKCLGFRSVTSPESVRKRITDLALQYIKPPLPLAPEARKSTAGECVIVLPIPGSAKPRAVEYNGRTEYWKRYGTAKRQMSHAEVEKAMGSPAADKELEAQRRLA